MIDTPTPLREGPNPRLHALAVCAIGVPLLAVSLSGFFLLFTQSHSRTDETPVNVQMVEAPRTPPPKSTVPKPRRPPIRHPVPLPSQPRFPDTLVKNIPPPVDTEPAPETPQEETETEGSGGSDSARLTGTTSAYAILKPMPEIPKEFLGHAMEFSVTVKFKVGADGNSVAELLHASPDPKLNQWLLEVFKQWRFYPAIRFNQGVASELVITVPIKVY